MKPSNWKWAAVAVFAAVMTVAEVFALQAAARDAKHWIASASESAREVQSAGLAVAAAVTGAADRDRVCESECIVIRKGVSKEAAKIALREARVRLLEVKKQRAAVWSLLQEKI